MSDTEMNRLSSSDNDGIAIRSKSLEILPKKAIEKKKAFDLKNIILSDSDEPSTSKKINEKSQKKIMSKRKRESDMSSEDEVKSKKKKVVRKKPEKVYKIGDYTIKESGIINSVKKALTHTPVIIVPIFSKDDTN